MICKNCKLETIKEYCTSCEKIMNVLLPYFEPVVSIRNKRHKERLKEYNQRPEVKAKVKRYRKRPEVKARISMQMQTYNQRPEVKARRKELDLIRKEKKEKKEKEKNKLQYNFK